MSPSFKRSLRSVSLSLLAVLAASTAARAQDSCSDPRLAELESRIEARAETVSQALTLNERLLRERGKSLTKATRLTYGATALATVGIGVAATAAGAAVGGAAGFFALDEAAGGAGLVVTDSLMGHSLAMLFGGAGLGLLAGVVGGPIVLSNAPGGVPENVTGAGEYARTQLPSWSIMPSEQLIKGIPDFMSRFQDANRKVGASAMTEESSVQYNSRWYHMGWDEVKTMRIMVSENEQHVAIYDLEAQFLAAAKDEVARACAAATAASVAADSGLQAAAKPVSKPAEDFVPAKTKSGAARAGAGAAARIN